MVYRVPRALRRKSVVAVVAAALVLAFGPVGAEPAPEPVTVVVDQAKLVKLPDQVTTIVVGNPMIADVTLQPNGTMVVTGKGYGTTNVIALDRKGSILMDKAVQVEGSSDKLVTVYRGVERESYSCTPLCQKRVTLGDSQPYFASTLEQAGNFTAHASGTAGSK